MHIRKLNFLFKFLGSIKAKKYFPTEILFFIDKREERESSIR